MHGCFLNVLFNGRCAFVHFLVIGDGDLREKYQLKYQGLELSFVPKIPKSMVQHALSLCDILYFFCF